MIKTIKNKWDEKLFLRSGLLLRSLLTVTVILIAYGLYHFDDLITDTRVSEHEELLERVRLCGRRIENNYREFSKDFQHYLSSNFFLKLFDCGAPLLPDWSIRLKRFYARYEELIDEIRIYDLSGNFKTIRKENANYYTVSAIQKGSPPLEYTGTWREGKKYYRADIIEDSSTEHTLVLITVLDPVHFIESTLSMFHFNTKSRAILVDEYVRAIDVLLQCKGVLPGKLKLSPAIIENIKNRYEYVGEDTILSGDDPVNLLTAYYPFELFDHSMGIIISLDRDDLYHSIFSTNLTLGGIFICTVMLVITAFLIVLKNRKLTERALGESQVRMRAILDNSTSVIYLKDTKGRYLFINKRYESLFHVSNEQIEGKTDYDIFPEEVAEQFKANDQEIIIQNRAVEFEETAPHEDGIHSYITIKFPLYDSKGEMYAVCGMSTDISTRKQSEIALKQAYRKLRNTQSQLVQSGKLASIGELASGVAHELNQPLMVIRGNAQLIQRNLEKNNSDGDALADQIEPIVRNTKRMMNIINHLRIFSRQSPSTVREVDVNVIIEESFLMVGEQLRLRDIEVQQDLDANLPKVKGDPNQLEQVFLNLITNARDAIEARGDGRRTDDEGRSIEDNFNSDRNEYRGKLEIITRMGETNNPRPRPGQRRSDDGKMEMEGQHKQDNIQITSRQGGQQARNFVEILMRDNGGGIPVDKADKIFDPFFTTKEVGKGTGLGLSISYGIIQDHEGEIEVAKTGTAGTTLRVRLPIING